MNDPKAILRNVYYILQNSKRLLAVKYFLKKASSKTHIRVLNTPLEHLFKIWKAINPLCRGISSIKVNIKFQALLSLTPSLFTNFSWQKWKTFYMKLIRCWIGFFWEQISCSFRCKSENIRKLCKVFSRHLFNRYVKTV